MDTRFMEKTTFSEICKMMENGGEKDRKLIKDIFDLGLVFLPALISPETALLTNLSVGTDLLAVKSVVSSVGNKIKAFLAQGQADFVSRYERAQAAQVLLVFSAYFDTMKKFLPDESRAIAISDKENAYITEKSLLEYKEWITKSSSSDEKKVPSSIMNYKLDFPGPLEAERIFEDRLIKFYELLNENFIEFIGKLSFTEKLSGTDFDRFMAALRQLPQEAVANYSKQYFELESESIDFRIWANKKEHYEIKEKIDIGFQKISNNICDFSVVRNARGSKTIEKYEKKYEQYINDELVQTSEIDASKSMEIVFPSKKAIFVPQKFKALCFERGTLIENEKIWMNQQEKDEIGIFVADTLRHSITGKLPLLILGVPGAGKTLLSHMLAAQILSHEYHVIIIRLRDVIAESTITQQINEQIEHDFANQCSWDEIVDESSTTPVLLIFDGYDELLQASGKTYSDYITKIMEFQRNQLTLYGIQVKCILTSRTTLIDKARIPEGTTVIKLSEFDKDRIEKWINIWNETNSLYFKKHNVKPFAIDSHSKVYELAKQPLLLLLLALYDSNDNALKHNIELTGAQLYNCLIREFIEREQRKNEKFLNYTEDEQKDIVDCELQKISIAALGMYNRRVLYIRDEELDKDLRYLLTDSDKGNPVNTEYGRLKKSDLVLGSFFFIHRSDSVAGIQYGNEKAVAYEFLHNTFGEFLTANYIVCELFKNIDEYIYLKKGKRQSNWSLKNPTRGWCVSLSYAPLSSRPIVIKMIREWAHDYFYEKLSNEDKNQVPEAMNHILEAEISHIIEGEEIFILNKILSENGNPFEKKEYLVHLACYSLNLLILGTIVSEKNQDTFYCKREIWDKLICLWQYAFQQEELLSFSGIFITKKFNNGKEELCCLQYSPNEEDYGTPIMRLERISQAIGDTKCEALISTILGDGDVDVILDYLERNNFEVSATYLLNKLLKELNENQNDTQKMMQLVSRFTKISERYENSKILLIYYLLLDCLLGNNIIPIDSPINFLLPGFRYFMRQRRAAFRLLSEDTFNINMILQNVFCSVMEKCLMYNTKQFEEVVHLVRTLDIDLQLLSLSTILRLKKSGKLSKGLNGYFFRQTDPGYIVRHALDDFIHTDPGYIVRHALDDFIHTDPEYIVRHALDDFIHTDMEHNIRYAFNNHRTGWILLRRLNLIVDILREIPFISSTDMQVFFTNSFYICEHINRYDKDIQASMLKIRLCKLAKDYGITRIFTDYPWWPPYNISLKNIYEYSIDTAYEFCCLIDKDDIKKYNLEKDLRWIKKTHGQELSVKFYRRINRLLLDLDSNAYLEKKSENPQTNYKEPSKDLLGTTAEMYVIKRGNGNLRGVINRQYKAVIPKNYLAGEKKIDGMINRKIIVELVKINNGQYEAKPNEEI